MKKRDKLLKLERRALKHCPRLQILDEILSQSFKVLNKTDPYTYLCNPTNQSVLDFVLDQRWTKGLATTRMTDNLMET